MERVVMFKNITLEVSLKPFKRTDEDYIRSADYDLRHFEEDSHYPEAGGQSPLPGLKNHRR